MKLMRKIYGLAFVTFFCLSIQAQKNNNLSLAIINTQSAMPFNKLGSLVTGVVNPGVEIGYGFNWRTKQRHDWYQNIKLGYFYHRFVQHGIPLYTELGYRYKFSNQFYANAAVGAGYFHSIPATSKFRLENNGEYKNDKGLGRMQGIITAGLGISYIPNPSGRKPFRLFSEYQQRLQAPFVRSYVPLLPYNSLMFGAAYPLNK
jgi:hypothetical protein